MPSPLVALSPSLSHSSSSLGPNFAIWATRELKPLLGPGGSTPRGRGLDLHRPCPPPPSQARPPLKVLFPPYSPPKKKEKQHEQPTSLC